MGQRPWQSRKNQTNTIETMRTLLTLTLLLLLSTAAMAQPANDECINAIPLTDVVNWCSAPAAYTTVGSTVSPQANPGCFPNNTQTRDVWFSFTAGANTASISVIGGVPNGVGGNMQNPQLAVYGGNCDALNLLGCSSDAQNNDEVNLFITDLVIGATYYLRVSARFSFTGTFRLCVNNFNAVPEPSGDCVTGVILCDKSPFSVGFLAGVGNDPTEMAVTCVAANCLLTESSSTWYKWTCENPGSLTFTITPTNPIDDIDFVVYELPNGVTNCAGKNPIRCMASGENVGVPLNQWLACMGPTGLSLTDTDLGESCGCQPGDNNFVQAINMVAGRSYALVINNFSQSGSGFSIEFGGTGTFLGPTVDYNPNPATACVGQPVTYTDASSFVGGISQRTWNFGPDATPSTATGPGPHNVVYNRPGTKGVILTVRSAQGCLVTQVGSVNVTCCADHFTVGGNVTDVPCPDEPTGSIGLNVSSSYAPYTFAWSNTALSQNITGLAPGAYTVTITDQATCTTERTFTVGAPPPYAFDTLITMPTCNMGTDGAVTLLVSGGTPPYQYNWENTGFVPNNTISSLSNGNYTVVVRDANGCDTTLVIPVFELELLLDPTVVAITRPSCFGFSDGAIEVVVANGLPPYQYDFNDGNGFVSSNAISELSAGTYSVTVRDANFCLGSFVFSLEDYPPLTLSFDVRDVLCFGENNGEATAVVGGGTGTYAFAWSNGGTTATIGSLPAGTYAVTVLDSNGCEIQGDTLIIQPPPLSIAVLDVVDNICFGASEGAITTQAMGGVQPYEFSTDGVSFQESPVLANLPAGDFIVTVMDANGCTSTANATITQPPQLSVDAGPDVFIQLGFDTIVTAIASTGPVTFAWFPTDSITCLNTECSLISVNPVNTTTYLVTVIDGAGCVAIDTITIRVIKDRPIYIPNVFSPNSDGINDGFTLYGGPAARRILDLKIFSRWGSLVFEGKNLAVGDLAQGWDGQFLGRPMDQGVFVYVVTVEFVDGEAVTYEGDVTLMR